jgi:DNA-binding Xre family transcriptional regulator
MSTRLTSTKLASVGRRWSTAVRTELDRQKKTLTDIATSAGVTRQYLGRVLDGHTPTLPVETYLAVCEALSINPNRYATIHRSTPPWESSK